jgi:hypothetical protein
LIDEEDKARDEAEAIDKRQKDEEESRIIKEESVNNLFWNMNGTRYK